MRLTPESRLLLAVAGRIVPQESRAEWAREWESELWYWLTATPEPAALSARLELARHSCGAVLDAFYLRFDREEVEETVHRILRHPGFPIAAASLLLLAMGAATDWFARTRRALDGPSYPNAHRIAILAQNMPFLGRQLGVSPAKVTLWDHESRSLEGAAMYVWYRTAFGEPARELPAAKVGADFFGLLGADAVVGRLFRPADAVECPDCAVLSYQSWKREFGGDRTVVGRAIKVDGRPARVIGVLPRRFWFLDAHPAVWTLYIPGETWQEWPIPLAGAICRLRPRVSAEAAQSELRAMAARTFVTVTPLTEALRRRAMLFLAIYGFFTCAGVLFSLAGGGVRRAAFSSLTVSLGLTSVFLAAHEFTDSTELLAIWALLVASTFAVYLCAKDRRVRCRVCLHRLTRPVRIGHAGQVLLDPAGTELLCPSGHGMLYTPEVSVESEYWVRVGG